MTNPFGYSNRLLQPSLRACEAISRIACLIYHRGVSLVKATNESFGLGGEIASSCLLAMTNLRRVYIMRKLHHWQNRISIIN